VRPSLTGAGARGAQVTIMGHHNREDRAHDSVRAEPTVKLGSVGTGMYIYRKF
jgi:hypothetical protein